MATVNLPDGRQINFPDGMSNDAMSAAVKDFLMRSPGETSDGHLQSPTRFQKRTGPTGGDSIMPDANTPAALLMGVRRGISGNLSNVADAYTKGPMHYLMGREPSMAAGIDRARQEASGADAALAESNPFAATTGKVAGSVGAGMALTPTPAYHAATGLLPTLAAGASYLGRNAASNAAVGTVTGATEGDTLAERGNNAMWGAGIGGAAGAVAPIIGKAIQSIPNAAQMAYTGARNLFTTRGHDGMAGNVLRETSGNMPINIRRSPLQGMELRTAQATGIPGVAGLEQAMERRINAAAGSAEDIVQSGRTPRQMAALSDALVPGSSGQEPRGLLTAAAERGAKAVQNADEAITKTESGLWGRIGDVKINAVPMADSLEAAFQALPENQRAVATQAGAYINRVRALGDQATITGKESINGIRSDLLKIARDARASGNTDAEKAYTALAGRMADYIGTAPEIAGTPARQIAGSWAQHPAPPTVQAHLGPNATWTPGQTIPAVPGNPAVLSNWNSARQFTRESNNATGFPEISRLLSPNAQGNITTDPARAFASFFPQSGSMEGVRRLEGMGQFGGGNELGQASRDYFRTSVLNKGRTGTADAAGRPQISPGAIARDLNARLPLARTTPTFAGPETTQLGQVSEAASLLARPQEVARTTGSNTFNKFENNQLLHGALGQAGAPLVGGLMGAAAADYATPLPSAAAWPLGFAAGAFAGSKGVAPMLAQGRLGSMLTAPAHRGVEQALIKALKSPDEFVRLHALQALESRRIGDPGWASGLIEMVGRGAAPTNAHVGAN